MFSRLSQLYKFTSTAIFHSSLDLLKDESLARGYVYARGDAAALLADAIVWTASDGGLRRAEYKGVVLFRDLSGYNLGLGLSPVWGVVQIGTRNFRVQTEAQMLAYLLSRFHSTTTPATCALTEKQ